MLNIARTLAPFEIPLVGVNQGRLGFLTDLSLESMKRSLSAMLQGEYITEKRMLLKVLVHATTIKFVLHRLSMRWRSIAVISAA